MNLVNGRAVEVRLDPSRYTIEPSGPGIFSVLIDGRSYQATVLAPGTIQVNDRIFSIEIVDPRELRVRAGASASEGRQNVVAPMPGKVVRTLVSVGDTVEAGQGLIVVEAMKMQNEMKSPKAGVVIELKKKDGATVSAGEILVVIE